MNSRCVQASLFGSFGQLDGTARVVKGTDEVKIEYSRSLDGLSWTQYSPPHSSLHLPPNKSQKRNPRHNRNVSI